MRMGGNMKKQKLLMKMPENQEMPKISEMLVRMCEGYLSMGKDLEQRHNLLSGAITAWNIATCHAPSGRQDLIDQFIEKYAELNNFDISDNNCQNLRKNIEQLIQVKDEMYPDVKKLILRAWIEERDGREHVMVVSMPLDAVEVGRGVLF